MSPDLVHALRAETPAAPRHLRERIAAVTATSPPQRRFTSRRILSLAVPVAAGLSLAVALAVGLNTAVSPSRPGATPETFEAAPAQDATTPGPLGEAGDRSKIAKRAARTRRRQARRWAARRTTARRSPCSSTARTSCRPRPSGRSASPGGLGGYVVSVNYSTPEPGDGTAAVRLRIPVSRVQAAIVEFSGMGRILTQETQITDLQQGLDELTRRIRDLERRAAQAGGAERARLMAQIEALRNQRVQINRQAAYATVNLDLTTHEPKAPAAAPGRLGRALDDAVGILLAELVIAAYALIVASPFIVLGLAAFFGNRAYRRHADQRLLERA